MTSISAVGGVLAGQRTLELAARRSEEIGRRATGAEPAAREDAASFAERLRESLDAVAEAQSEATRLTRDFEVGRETDLTKVVVAQQVSSLGFQLTLNVRNKALSAYKDVMSMPV